MQEQQRPVPPYVPYRTFRTFLEYLREGIPARIDRSVWGQRFSGSSGNQLMTTLKALSLVHEDGRPAPELEMLVHAEGDERRRLLRSLLERFYQPVFQLDLTRATRSQFHEAFRSFGAREGVLTKCEAFFVRAAQDAGVELSQYVLARRHGSRRLSQPPGRPRNAQQDRPPQHQQQPQPKPSPSSSRLAVAEMILSKYPDFDPSWAPEVQAKWMEGMTRLYEGLAAAGGDGDGDGRAAGRMPTGKPAAEKPTGGATDRD